MATVKLYFNVEGLLRKVYRDIAGLPRKVADVNWFAVAGYIDLFTSEWVTNLHILSLFLRFAYPRLKTCWSSSQQDHINSTYPWRSLLNMLSKSRTQGWLAALETLDLTQEKKSWRLTLPIIYERICNIPMYNYYHMTHTAPRALSLQNYWENPCMRAVRDGESRAGKSSPALLGSRTALIRWFYQ